MHKFLLKRVGNSIIVFLVATTLCFLLINAMPGDIVTYEMGPNGNTPLAEMMRKQFGLDKPIYFRYIIWLKNLFTANLGDSYMFRIPVIDVIKSTLPYTLVLTGTAFVFAMFISLIIGIITAVRKNSRIDYILSVMSLIGVSIPEIWIGSMVVILCSNSLNMLQYIGQAKFSYNLVFSDYVKMSIFPFLILVMSYVGLTVRYVKSAFQEVLVEDYIMSAKSRGISKIKILFKHALKNALIPIITSVSNLLPTLINSTIILETIFNCPGIGRIIIYSSRSRDYPVLMGIIIFTIIAIIITNLLADLLYLFVDPRIEYC